MISLPRRHTAGIIAGIAAAFAMTILCYWSSLSGPFLFDDIPNLEIMGERGGLTTAENYAEFILSGRSGPTGRPLSLASFALDGQNWPTDPRPFRITNLIIHLVNGLLVFFLSRLIFTTTNSRETADKLALLCATLWLLHPMLVSTTAYIIQRMTQLGCLFTLLGLLAYMQGRKQLPDNLRKGWAWIILGMGSCGLLAILSKESGIMLPLYALVIEVTVFGSAVLARQQKMSLIAVLCMPLIAFVAYMFASWDAIVASFQLRPFTMQERLLTEGVVLIDYLRQLVVPQLSGLGLFHDDFPVSKGLLNPIATVLSLLTIATLLFLAIRWRKVWPLASLGILWFFAGHSLEAGPLALELYFEHRNYLPLLGPLILICSFVPMLSTKLRGFLPLLILLFVAFESFLTWQSAKPWGNEDWLMRIALLEHPDSLRAQQYVSNKFIIHGNYPKALEVQEGLAAKFPQHTSTRLSILNLKCLMDELTENEVDATRRFLRQSAYDTQIIGFYQPLMINATNGTCTAFGPADVHTLFDEILRNPVMMLDKALRGATYYHRGIAYKNAGNLEMAIEQMDLSYEANPHIDVSIQQVVWALEAGDADAAERYLTLARRDESKRLLGRGFRTADFSILQNEIDKLRGSGR